MHWASFSESHTQAVSCHTCLCTGGVDVGANAEQFNPSSLLYRPFATFTYITRQADFLCNCQVEFTMGWTAANHMYVVDQ